MNQPDIWIIGAGFSALAGLWQAEKKNLKARLVAPNGGASQHFSGAFDLIDPRWCAPKLKPWEWPTPAQALTDFIRGHPEHLYAELMEHTQLTPQNAAEEIKKFLTWLGLPVAGTGEEFLTCFAANGRVKPALFSSAHTGVPSSQLSENTKIAVLSMPGVPDYPAHLIAAELKKVFPNVFVHECVTLPIPSQAGITRLINHFEKRETQDEFIHFLSSTLSTCDLILSPPVLGLQNFSEFIEKLSSKKFRVVEMLSVPPSTAGLRANQHIQKFLEKKSALLSASVSGFLAEGKKIISLKAESSDTEYLLKAENFLLASGKFLGGGLKRDSQFHETIFDLPLWKFTKKATPLRPETKMSSLISDDALSSQAFLSVGIRTNRQGQPISETEFLFENLKACGHVLGGFDFTRDRCGLSVSILSVLRCF